MRRILNRNRKVMGLNHSNLLHLSAMLLWITVLSGCSHYKPQLRTDWDLTETQRDSINFAITHHYTVNYNFQVVADSLELLSTFSGLADGLERTDSCAVYHSDQIVVADIAPVSRNSLYKRYYIKVARDQETMGWISEDELLKGVVPCDPISQFIHLFTSRRTIVFCIILGLAALSYLYRLMRRKQVPLVHFNDIDSFYPTLFCLVTAASATLYGTMQVFAPDLWIDYYYHPTLNPLSLPLLPATFIASVWLLLITFIAVVDDVRVQLSRSDGITYLLGLGCIWFVVYLIFSLTVQIYIGYPLLIVYCILAIRLYRKRYVAKYVCGQCGKPMRHLGRCPHCGAINK